MASSVCTQFHHELRAGADGLDTLQNTELDPSLCESTVNNNLAIQKHDTRIACLCTEAIFHVRKTGVGRQKKGGGGAKEKEEKERERERTEGGAEMETYGCV